MLSVIIPVYNVEKYVVECLRTLYKSAIKSKQNEKIEIIIINDGSTDTSLSVIENYIKDKSNLFCVLSQENQGVAIARNNGLALAKKKYITFVDPDDYVVEEYFEIILETLERDVDLLVFDIQNFSAETGNDLEVFNGMDDYSHGKWTSSGSLANKVMRRDIAQQIDFTKGLIYEDTEFIYKYLLHVKNYEYIRKCLYKYRVGRKDSITTQKKNNVDDIYKILEQIVNYYDNNLIKNNKEDFVGLEYQFIKILLGSNYYRQLKYGLPNVFEAYNRVKYAKLFLEKYYPNWKNNELLKNNEYFKFLMGKNYMNKLEEIGSSFIGTYKVLILNKLHKFKR